MGALLIAACLRFFVATRTRSTDQHRSTVWRAFALPSLHFVWRRRSGLPAAIFCVFGLSHGAQELTLASTYSWGVGPNAIAITASIGSSCSQLPRAVLPQ